MKVNPPGPPANSLFDTLQQRHPDVDLVVLPPEGPVTTVASTSGPTARAHAAERLDEAARAAIELWPDPSPGDTTTRLRHGTSESEVRAVSRTVVRPATPEEGLVALERLVERLRSGGWRPRLVPGEVARLTAARDLLDVVATMALATGVVTLTLTGDPVPVGIEQAREIVRAGAR